MADVVQWDGVKGGGSRSKDGIRNLRLVSGNSYEIRFVGHPIQFFKYFVAGKSAIVKDKENNIVKRKHGLDPGVRYAANVLLRNDVGDFKAGQVYLLEFPQSIYNDVCDWASARKADPGGKSGCNFSIKVTGIKKDTRYKTVGLDITPFTEEEKEYLRANVYALDKLFKDTPDAELEAKLGLVGTAPTPQVTQPAPATAAAPEAPTGGQDLPF